MQQQVSTEFSRARDEAARARLLAGLKYAGLNERRNMISTHHEDTYKWAFRDSRRFILGDSSHESSDERGPEVTAWDSLTDWLRSNDELYWVSGKAGAGKSTFMAFLSRDSRTRELLDSWSPGARILSHFLWSAGQPLQKSVKGTLCSLLYQILFMDEDLFGRIIQNFPAAMTKDAVTDWSEPELEDLLQQTLSAAPMGTFIIIDGLDEVLSSDGSMKLLGLISRLQKTPGVKICVSSRPEPAFDRSLSRRPNLKLQDLTEHDIRCFVRATLEPYLTSGLEKSQSSLGDLADHICDTAQGVFLWVRIVLNSLQRGLENGDSFDDLLHRAQAFPRGLHELFTEMWRRLGDDEELYQLEAARYFNQVLSSRDVQLGVDISILEMMIALDESVRRSFLDLEEGFATKELIRKCELIATHIRTRCAGILECYTESYADLFIPPSPYDSVSFFLLTKVRFIHRAASDFLTSTMEGAQILSCDHSTNIDRTLNCLRARLVLTRMFTPVTVEYGVFGEDDENMNHASKWLCNLGHSFWQLVQDDEIQPEHHDYKAIIWQFYRTYRTGCFPYFHDPGNLPSSAFPSPDLVGALACNGVHGIANLLSGSFDRNVDHIYRKYIAHCLINGVYRSYTNYAALHTLREELITFLQAGDAIDGRTIIPEDLGFIKATSETSLQILGCPRSFVYRIVDCLCQNGPFQTESLLVLLNEVLRREPVLEEPVAVYLLPCHSEKRDGAMMLSRLPSAIQRMVEGSLAELAVFMVPLGYLLSTVLGEYTQPESQWPQKVVELAEISVGMLSQAHSSFEGPTLVAIKPNKIALRGSRQPQLWEPNYRSKGWSELTQECADNGQFSWRAESTGYFKEFHVFRNGKVWDVSSVIEEEFNSLPLDNFITAMREHGYFISMENCAEMVPNLPSDLEEAIIRKYTGF